MTSLLPIPDPSEKREFRASHAVHPHGVTRPDRIFVNRNLRMRSVGAVGFDLDYTLANYRLREIDNLAFGLTQQKLVEHRGYPERILNLRFDPDFVVRGLVVDRRRGNLLKMDYHNYVVRASHGLRPLGDAERKRIYRTRRIRTSAKSYASVDTHFHLPEVYLYASLIDDAEAHGVTMDMNSIYQDVRDMIDQAHADGSIKREIQADPGRFLDPSPRLGEFLTALREGGKKVFLLTNSESYYTDVLLSHLLEQNADRPWRSYFDLVVTDARKPRFFQERNRPGEWKDQSPGGAPVYSGGDVWRFEKMIGFHGDEILYWGDHTYGDILRSKKSVGWRTAMIIPELESEISVTERAAGRIGQLEDAIEQHVATLRDEQRTQNELTRLERMLARTETSAPEARRELARRRDSTKERLAHLAQERDRLHTLIARLDDECNRAYHEHWGPLFREGNEISRFGHQVRDFACIYTSRVANFLNYPVNTYFRAPIQRMPHEL
ncbi:MAG: 5' nucleotidase [Gemmatimonadota bacterium]|nr:MAG: 5' nucleotidase [Gemmatimonadota bacterium]